MTSTSAYAPFNISYSARTAYVSSTEYANSPQSLDLNNLVAGGSAQANATALAETIARASGWIDQFTCGAWGTLCATVETENARIWGSYRNTLPVKTKYWPVVEVQAFSYSPTPGGLANGQGASVTPSNSITVYPQEFEVSLSGSTQFFTGGLQGFGGFGTTGITFRTEYDCQWQYVCGWVNTPLAASVAAGSQSIQPTSLTGIYPGTMLTLYDSPLDEQVTVASTYVPGTAAVPLTTPLMYAHTNTAIIANLPPAIKQAAIWAVNAFIKQRGSGALEVSDMGAITQPVPGAPQNLASDIGQAMMLLQPFKQMVVSY